MEKRKRKKELERCSREENNKKKNKNNINCLQRIEKERTGKETH
jgi:hypothetical protein